VRNRVPAASRQRPGALLALAVALLAGACQGDGDARVIALRVLAAGDPSALERGEVLAFRVRALTADGTSTDVTAQASCQLDAPTPPGELDGARFVARQPGSAELQCRHAAATGSLRLTVLGHQRVAVRDIQSGAVPAGALVEVEVVVTGVEPPRRDGDALRRNFWAQDRGGGIHSGIHVMDFRTGDTAMPRPAVGQLQRVRGRYTERHGRSRIEYEQVDLVGAAEVVADTVPVEQASLALWDGCLITVADVELLIAPGDAPVLELGPPGAPDSAGARLRLSDALLDPAGQPDWHSGQVFERVTGILRTALERDRPIPYLSPRDQADLRPRRSSVRAVRDGAGRGLLQLEVVVTAADPVYPSSFWGQDPGGGPGTGIYFRDRRASREPLALAPGSLVAVTGRQGEPLSGGGAAIDVAHAERRDTAPRPVQAAELTLADLATPELAERWDGNLVRLMQLRARGDAGAHWIVEDASGRSDATLFIGKQLHDPAPVAGQIYDSITGILFRARIAGEPTLTLRPRTASDLIRAGQPDTAPPSAR
jgi:hypothetical protein